MNTVVKVSAPRCSRCQSTNVARLLNENGRCECLECGHHSPEGKSVFQKRDIFINVACRIPNEQVEYVYF